jgi:methylenetetrahydrofolate reductase (NADPH)
MLVGGGGVQEGPFADAEALLASGALQRAGFRRLGLAAHPEGHPHADAAALDRALDAKLRLARGFAEEVWLVTQFAFEAAPVLDWLARLRRREPDILVRVGVSGPARPATLLAYAARCGVGASLQALKGRPGLIGRMTRRWRPDALAGRLAEAAAAGETGPIALHLFPFGGLEATADWLEEARA